MINRIVEVTFHPAPFDSTGLNLHAHADHPASELVLFVHGLNGGGYKTWHEMPRMIFEEQGGTPSDVAIYDYASGGRSLLRVASLEFYADQLLERLISLEENYGEIYIVAHSLGGILASAALKKYLTSRLASGNPLTPISGLILFSSPRMGSSWAKRWLAPLVREFRWLRPFSKPTGEINQFFEDYVESHAVASPGHRAFLLPKYAGVASNDHFVTKMSATFDVPTTQQIHLDGTHPSIVKPTEKDRPQVDWLNETRRKIRHLRAQWHREDTQRKRHSSQSVVERFIVTELQSVRPEVDWEETYNEVRRSVTLTSRVDIYDRRDRTNDPVDLLIAVHKDVIVLQPNSMTKDAVLHAREIQGNNPKLIVGVSPLGERCDDAKVRIESWLPETAGSFYVHGSRNLSELTQIMTRWIQLVLARDPKRQPIEDAGTEQFFRTKSVQYGHSKGREYL